MCQTLKTWSIACRVVAHFSSAEEAPIVDLCDADDITGMVPGSPRIRGRITRASSEYTR